MASRSAGRRYTLVNAVGTGPPRGTRDPCTRDPRRGRTLPGHNRECTSPGGWGPRGYACIASLWEGGRRGKRWGKAGVGHLVFPVRGRGPKAGQVRWVNRKRSTRGKRVLPEPGVWGTLYVSQSHAASRRSSKSVRRRRPSARGRGAFWVMRPRSVSTYTKTESKGD